MTDLSRWATKRAGRDRRRVPSGLSSFAGVIRGPFEPVDMDGVTLSRDECLSFLERERVGRLGVSIDALPAIVPINYFLVGDTVVFRAAGQSKLFRGCNGSVLALEVDGYDPFAAIGWSVLAQGAAKEISDLEKLRSMRGHSQWPWAFDRHDRFLELQTSVLYGWRFVERT